MAIPAPHDKAAVWRRIEALLDRIPHDGNRELVRRYANDRLIIPVKPATVFNDVNALMAFCRFIEFKCLEAEVERPDIVAYLNQAHQVRIWRNVKKDGTSTITERKVPLGPGTLWNRKQIIRSFYRWLRDTDEYPPEVRRLGGRGRAHGSVVAERLIDESLIQLWYSYDGSSIVDACLAYLEGPFTADLRNLTLDEAQDWLADWDEYPNPQRSAPLALRIDYDLPAERIVEHSACHLHLDPYVGGRIPVLRLPSPRQFFEFCMRAMLPVMYHERRIPELAAGFMGKVNGADTGVEAHADGLVGLHVPAAGTSNRVPS